MTTTFVGRNFDAKRFTGQVWRDGEFGFTLQRSVDTSVQRRRERTPEQEWAQNSIEVHGVQATLACRQDAMDTDPGMPVPRVVGEADNLGSSNVANSHSRAKRGTNGLTGYGKLLIKNAASYLERRYGKTRLSFGTLTIPSLSAHQYQELCQGWAEIVRQMIQWLTRKLIARRLPPLVVGCVEIQEQRYRQTHVAYPHLHLLCVGRLYRGAWKIRPIEYRKAFLAILNSRLTHPLKLEEACAVENIVQVKHSVRCYLAKYLSKGLKASTEAEKQSVQGLMVSSWYFCSIKLRNAVKAERWKGCTSFFTFLAEKYAEGNRDLFVWVKQVEIVVDGWIRPWGLCGQLSELGIEVAQSWLFPNRKIVA